MRGIYPLSRFVATSGVDAQDQAPHCDAVLFIGFVLFGWCSGIFAIILAFRGRNRFLGQSRRRQRWIVLLIWFIHFVALVVFFLMLAPQI